MKFGFETDPSVEVQRRLAGLDPANPFHTEAYLAAKRELGFRPVVITAEGGGLTVAACAAFLKDGRLNRILEIPSLASFVAGSSCWNALMEFCGNSQVAELIVDTFASPAVEIPTLPGERERRERCEFVVDLTSDDVFDRLHSKHRQSVKRAVKLGIRIEEPGEAGLADHVRTKAAAMERRGQSPGGPATDHESKEAAALLAGGAGTIVQARLEGRVVSSALFLQAREGTYYHSAGTTPEGRSAGASHLLLFEWMKQARSRGCRRFNLGGTVPGHEGLVRFKSRFGAEGIRLQAVRADVGGAMNRWAQSTIRLLRKTFSR